MRTRLSITLPLALALMAAGCALPTAGAPKLSGATARVTRTAAPAAQSSAAPTASPTAAPAGANPTPSATPLAPQPSGAPRSFTGLVLGLDGNPAANVRVTGYLIANNGAGVVSNNGSSLISDKGSSYRVQDTSLSTLTDAQGRFTLVSSNGRPLDLEAVQQDDVKAMQFDVGASASDVTLQLAHTGTLSGRVAAPAGSGVGNLTGVQVYVPGTAYMAMTDASGAFTIPNMPVGSYDLMASKTGLGTANASGVVITADHTTTAPALTLAPNTPQISGTDVLSGAPGALVTLKGQNFGTSTGATLEVTFGGAIATAVQRVDDQTLKVTVPSDARSGNIIATVGGLISNAEAFQVIKSLAISPRVTCLDLNKTTDYTATAVDTASAPVAAPDVSWSSDAPGVVTVDASGHAHAVGIGTAHLTITNAGVSDTLAVQVATAWPTVVTYAGTVAGNHDGTATGTAELNQPIGLVLDAAGNLYTSDTIAQNIRRVTPAGQVTTFAGSVQGYADGVGTAAQFWDPNGMVYDAASQALYVVEWAGQRLRRIAADGTVSTIAGTGAAGEVDGPGATAQLRNPNYLCEGADGTLYFTEMGNNDVRKVSFDTQGNATVSLVAGQLAPGAANGLGAAASFSHPSGIAIDAQGNLYVADGGNNLIRRIDPSGNVTTIAGDGTPGDRDGKGTAAEFDAPNGVAVDAAGNVYVADGKNNSIRRIAPDGTVTTIAGASTAGNADGVGLDARFSDPEGLTFGADGALYVADRYNHRIRKLTF